MYRETADSAELASALAPHLPDTVRLAAACVQTDAYTPALFQAHQQRFPEEAELIKRAVPKRLLEFLAARDMARELLSHLGAPALPIGRGHLGAPIWPEGYVGSIAHSAGMVMVVVASSAHVRALGLDLEPNLPLPPDVTSHVCLPGEQEGAPYSRGVFVVKEAFYKAHCTMHQRMLDFTEVRVTFRNSTWEALEIAPPATAIGPTTLAGSIVATAGWLAAFCAITVT